MSPIAFRSQEDICQMKDNGGLGIRDLYTINKSLLIQAAWNIVTNKNPFLSSVIKSKYYHNSSFWTVNTNGPRSVFWSSILQVKKELCANATYQLRAGNSSIWSTPWCSIWDSIHDHMHFQRREMTLAFRGKIGIPGRYIKLWLLISPPINKEMEFLQSNHSQTWRTGTERSQATQLQGRPQHLTPPT